LRLVLATCSCSEQVLDVGECDTYSDIPRGCSCESEPSRCEVEVRLLRGDSELAAFEGVVPTREYLLGRFEIRQRATSLSEAGFPSVVTRTSFFSCFKSALR
jgi:hypothetical protein